MKTETKILNLYNMMGNSRPSEQVVYICEYCGKEDRIKSDIERCERDCKNLIENSNIQKLNLEEKENNIFIIQSDIWIKYCGGYWYLMNKKDRDLLRKHKGING